MTGGEEYSQAVGRKLLFVPFLSVYGSPVFRGGEMEERLRVLVVDDNQDILHILQYGLESYGFEVRTCLSAEEAESVVSSGCYDFVMTDHDMEGMDGLELTRRLRERCARTVIIGMSGTDLGVEFLTAGANDFIRKPFVPYDAAMMLDGRDLPG